MLIALLPVSDARHPSTSPPVPCSRCRSRWHSTSLVRPDPRCPPRLGRRASATGSSGVRTRPRLAGGWHRRECPGRKVRARTRPFAWASQAARYRPTVPAPLVPSAHRANESRAAWVAHVCSEARHQQRFRSPELGSSGRWAVLLVPCLIHSRGELGTAPPRGPLPTPRTRLGQRRSLGGSLSFGWGGRTRLCTHARMLLAYQSKVNHLVLHRES